MVEERRRLEREENERMQEFRDQAREIIGPYDPSIDYRNTRVGDSSPRRRDDSN